MVKNHSVIADFSIVPLGHGESSVGKFVAVAVNALKSVEGLDFEITPMGTVLGAENLDTVFKAVRLAHDAVIARGVMRVESTLRIDYRRDKPRTMRDKVTAVKEYMERP